MRALAITRLPQVDKILREEKIVDLQRFLRREIIVQLIREDLSVLRAAGKEEDADMAAIVERVERVGRQLLRPSLRKVINGTGVILNTNLGRAPISGRALSELAEVGSGYCNLEIDLSTGKRGKRSQRIERLLQLLTGGEAALVVNNNAAAVLLVVNALARDKHVVVSRGELIEIGGNFRLPDVIEAGGAILKEVGTTNRTRLADYQAAIGPTTGLLLRCHRSNFEIRGFTEQPELEELCRLAEQSGVPLLEDLGSGALVSTSDSEEQRRQTVPSVVATGCDLVSFSGDKLLGGPQAGFIVGKKKWIEKLLRHPLYRALRLDKLMLALVERTLIAYLTPQTHEHLPVINMMTAPAADIKMRAEDFARTICDTCTNWRAQVVVTDSTAGGGSLPGESLASFGVQLACKGKSPQKIAEILRAAEPPVIGILQDEFMLDFRTINDEDAHLLLSALKQLDSSMV
jgi:L-seryl-tRNA(Ser) seleniumtransferase